MELTHTLRKQYLKEINNLREAHSVGGEKFRDALKVSFFDVTDGIDHNSVEVLNMKLSDMQKQFSVLIEEKSNTITYLTQTINKYKQLAPKGNRVYSTDFLKICSLQNDGDDTERALFFTGYH